MQGVMTGWQLLALAAAGAVTPKALVWLLSLRLGNAGIVDVAWSYSFVPIAWLYAGLGSGWWPRRLLVASLVTLWSLRLGTHLLARVRDWHPREDGRYARLREGWGADADRKMLGFFLLQGLLAAGLSTPFLPGGARPGAGLARPGARRHSLVAGSDRRRSARRPSARGLHRRSPGTPGARVARVCGPGRGIPTTSSSGWSGARSRCWLCRPRWAIWGSGPPCSCSTFCFG